MLRTDRFLFMLVLVGLLASGCRTYSGYDSKPKTYQAMQRSVEAFADELDRAEADFQTLKDAAEASDSLQSLTDAYQGLLDEHESLLETQRSRVERLSASSAHRSLHRGYGATVKEKRMVMRKYRRLVRSVHATVQGERAGPSSPDTERRYTIRPMNFPSLRDGGQLSMEQALAGR
ncbi:hypothetical protein [Salinibacter altiplanensis]|uniref:hypothetical protein n=1 Tax=Salinibacter altiplanensis TaxID=1803181 RepID=UPI000C9EE3C1|nr:hypothetical protein [Salinibacter altiplanensis]